MTWGSEDPTHGGEERERLAAQRAMRELVSCPKCHGDGRISQKIVKLPAPSVLKIMANDAVEKMTENENFIIFCFICAFASIIETIVFVVDHKIYFSWPYLSLFLWLPVFLIGATTVAITAIVVIKEGIIPWYEDAKKRAEKIAKEKANG